MFQWQEWTAVGDYRRRAGGGGRRGKDAPFRPDVCCAGLAKPAWNVSKAMVAPVWQALCLPIAGAGGRVATWSQERMAASLFVRDVFRVTFVTKLKGPFCLFNRG
jgi:hypothetical protein